MASRLCGEIPPSPFIFTKRWRTMDAKEYQDLMNELREQEEDQYGLNWLNPKEAKMTEIRIKESEIENYIPPEGYFMIANEWDFKENCAYCIFSNIYWQRLKYKQ